MDLDPAAPTFLATPAHSGYDDYTDSGVDWLGAIPAHWELRALKYSADFVQEKLDSKPDDLPYIGLEHIESGTGKLDKDEAVEDVSSKVVHFESGEVLFSKLRPYLAKVLLAEEDGVGTTELVPLRPVEDVDERFLAYQLLSKGFIEVMDAQTYGARMPRVSPDQLAEQKLALPPSAEQRAIAAFLDRATARIDTLIEKKERLVALLEEKRSALVSHVVTKGLDDDAELQDSEVEWLGEIPAGWDVVRLKFLTSLVTSGPRGWAEYYSEEGPIFLQVGNLSRGSLDLDLSEVEHVNPPEDAEGTRTRLEGNDLLLSITAYIGSIGVIPPRFGRGLRESAHCTGASPFG